MSVCSRILVSVCHGSGVWLVEHSPLTPSRERRLGPGFRENDGYLHEAPDLRHKWHCGLVESPKFVRMSASKEVKLPKSREDSIIHRLLRLFNTGCQLLNSMSAKKE